MILSAYCQMLRKIARRIQYFGMCTFRRDVVCVTAAVWQMRKELRLSLPEYLRDRPAFEVLFSTRI